MADDLERLVRSIEGESPSPDFVAALRERIVAESLVPAMTADDDPVVEIDLQSHGRETMMTSTHWKLAALVAAVVALIVSFVTLRDDQTLDTVGRDDTTSTTVTSTTEPSPDEADGLGSDAPLLTAEGEEVEAGTYRVETVGTPFDLTLEQPLTPQFNREGTLRLSRADPATWRGPGDEDIAFIRLTTLSDPSRPTEVPQDRQDGLPADDFRGWLDNLADGILVTDVQETRVGGFDAVRVDLELGDIECPSGRPFCAVLGTNFVDGVLLNPGTTYRIWMVDQGAETPLAIVAGAVGDADGAWLEDAEAILSTVAFGDPAPSPIQRPPAGSMDLPFLGGMRTDLGEGATVVPGPVEELGSIRFDGVEGWVQFFSGPTDLAGRPLESTDLLTRLQAIDGEMTDVDPISVDGVDATVLDVAESTQTVAVAWGPDVNPNPDLGWFLAPRTRVWLIDHPERGGLIVTAEALDGDGETFADIVARAEMILDSLEFVDLE